MTFWKFAACALFAAQVPSFAAGLQVPALFSDNMVLQAGKRDPIWGTAAPGEKVKVQLGSGSIDAVADAHGKWSALLDVSGQGSTPFTVTVSGDKSPSTITIKNVIVGEVWLASGQSNMFKPVGPGPGMQPNDNWQQVVADSANPNIRIFTVAMRQSDQPVDALGGKWEVASPQTTAKFTAAGYFFARDLNRDLHVPVGIIHSSWGGTRAEPWISAQGFKADPELARIAKDEYDITANFPAALKQYDEAVAQWAKEHGYDGAESAAQDKEYSSPSLPDGDWQPAPIGSMRMSPGVRWFRTPVNIPPDWAGRNITLAIGKLHGFDTVYYNGTQVGSVPLDAADKLQSNRNYQVPANLVKAGPALVAIRLVTQLPTAGVIEQSWRSIIFSGPAHIGYGPWKFKTVAEFPQLDAATLASYPKAPPDIAPFDTASHLFNAMINPLVPYSIAGVIWYQGESNADLSPWVIPAHAGDPWYSGDHPDPSPLYRKLFPALINDWRETWQQRGGTVGEFPFYYCQIANYRMKPTQPSESRWAEVREGQRVTLATVKGTGMAVLIDIGDAKDIHPTDKEDVGARLERWALADTYRHPMEQSGPLYESMKVEGNKIRINFTHLGGGLVARPLPDTYQLVSYKPDSVPLIKPMPGSELQGFEIAGPDGRFVWASAAIEGNTVVVSAPAVRQPAAVRYAWADNPTCNLSNQANLPASPFRTDDWWPKH